MHMILIAATFIGTIPTENDLLNGKKEQTYNYVSKDNKKIVSLTLIQKKGIFKPKREVILIISTSLKPWRNGLLTNAWKGSYTVKNTGTGTQIECLFIRKSETGITGNLVPTPRSRFKPINVTIHVDKYARTKSNHRLQIHFTAPKVRQLKFWKANKKITLY